MDAGSQVLVVLTLPKRTVELIAMGWFALVS